MLMEHLEILLQKINESVNEDSSVAEQRSAALQRTAATAELASAAIGQLGAIMAANTNASSSRNR